VKIKVNGEWMEFLEHLSLPEVLNTISFLPEYYVLAHNEHCIPTQDYPSVQLKEGDCLEILSPMQGG
jgi:thiamine biosynthesis protein ThiS